MVPLEKRRLLIFVFQNQKENINILARLIDQYIFFTYTETILRNAPRKRSCRYFVGNQGWWDIVVNNYSDKQFNRSFNS